MSVTVKIDGTLAHVTIDNPPVNAINQDMRAGLLRAVAETDAAGVSVVLLSCAGRTFVAGADVREFGKPPLEPHLPDVLNAIEAATAPWVAQIHGTALGGGLEIALACAYRVATPDARLGLPEVNLGIIPGAGGTVRLPRLIAPEAALDMVAGGRPVSASKALKLGLIDRVEADPDAVLSFARSITAQPRPAALLHADPQPLADPDAWQDLLDTTRKKARGQTSIIAATDTIAASLTTFGPQALSAERATFLRLREDPQAAALRHIFFAERSAARLPQTKGIAPRPIDRIGVIGGGTMGSGIAAACLLSGLSVTMIERDQDALKNGSTRVRDILQGAAKRGKLTRTALTETNERLTASTDYAALSDAQVVIEAVFEDMDIKRAVFAQLDSHTKPDAVLASNTSYLDITALAAGTKHPERVIGLHFFSPAHVMKLLEVIVPESADPTAIATGLALGKALGKIAVPSGVCDGFIGNRIMSAYRREADYMIEDGALPHDVDAAMRAFGFPIGVFQMQDLAGLDIAWAMRKRRATTRPPAERYVTIADQLCELGRLGRKTGKGWYDYSTDKNGASDPAVTALIEASSARNGITRTAMTPDRIMQRILTIMQAEGSAILSENIAASPDAIDVVMINGYGFPRWRGGPMFMSGITS